MANFEHEHVLGEQILSLHCANQESTERALDNTQVCLNELLNSHRDWIDDQRVVTQNLLNRHCGCANMTDEEVVTHLANRRNRTGLEAMNQAPTFASISLPQHPNQLLLVFNKLPMVFLLLLLNDNLSNLVLATPHLQELVWQQGQGLESIKAIPMHLITLMKTPSLWQHLQLCGLVVFLL